MSTLLNVVNLIVVIALAWTIYNNQNQENRSLILGLLALSFILILLDIIT